VRGGLGERVKGPLLVGRGVPAFVTVLALPSNENQSRLPSSSPVMSCRLHYGSALMPNLE
jgi:hypothetical protein